VFEDATPEMVRDFFWDDEFRSKWDDMLLYSSTLERCKDTGTMVVQWVRKVATCFSFFFVLFASSPFSLLISSATVAVPLLL